MMTNLLFSQASALGKRLAMVLTMLLIVGIGQAWGETETYTLNSSNNGGSVTTGNVSWSIASGAITVQSSNCKLTGTITVTLPAGATLNKVSIAKSNTWGSGATVTFKTGSTTLNTFSSSGDYTLTTNKDKLTYTFSKSGTSSKNAWVKSITVDYTVAAATTYKVTYNANGATSGTAPTDATSYTSGTTVTVKSNSGNLAKTGYTFGGWNTKSDGTGTNYTAGSGTFKITGNTTLYAKWNLDAKYTVTLVPGSGSVTNTELEEPNAGDGVTLHTPTLSSACQSEGWSFAGWATSAVATETSFKPATLLTGTYKPTSNITLYAVYKRTETTEGTPTVTTTTDKLTRETTGVDDGSTTYSSWSGKTVTSSAVYAGNSAGSNNSIQLRSNNSNSGVITTDSGGKVTKITVVWNSNTADGRTLDIYGKKSAYSAATELYSTSTQGTKLGSIAKGNTTLTITDDYEYIGLRSNSGAMYLTSISIEWETSTGSGTSSTTYYHSTPQCNTETSRYLTPKYRGDSGGT